MMKNVLAVVVLVMMQSMVAAQEWKSDLDEALTIAARDNKKVLLYFSVPEACAICEELERNVLASDTFKVFAKDNYILARPDFSGQASMDTKTKNLLVVEKYNKDGFFPLVVILDPNSRVLGKAGIYNNETPEQYIKLLKGLHK